ncbi:MAG: SH3 domain-containing protein [Desulfovibrio sp.]
MDKFVLLVLACCILCSGCVAGQGGNMFGVQGKSANKQSAPVKVEPAKAVAFGTSNVREKASSKTPVVFQLQKNDQATLISRSGNWYEIETAKGKGFIFHKLVAVDFIEGEKYSGVVTTGQKIYEEENHKSKLLGTTSSKKPTEVIGRVGNYYQINHGDKTGYIYRKNIIIDVASRKVEGPSVFESATNSASETFTSYAEKNKSVRDAAAGGRYDTAFKELDKRYGKPESDKKIKAHAEDIGLLPSLERGYLEFEVAEYKKSIAYLDGAEAIFNERDDRSHLAGAGSSLLDFGAGLLSMDEMTSYSGPGFERVLMLNFKALAYLMEGERKAYNVTRRAIDIQNEERKAFEEVKTEAEKKAEEEKKELAKKSKSQAKKNGEKSKENMFDFSHVNFLDVLTLNDKTQSRRAKKVKSAYVNPLGDYINAAVLEIDGYEDPGQRSSAGIAYKKALELNPSCTVLKKAMKDMQCAPKGRVVHIIMADGFCPEKELKTSIIPISIFPTTLKTAVYKSIPTRFAYGEVRYGKRSSKLQMLSDIEAMALRHEADAMPVSKLKVVRDMVRSIVERHGLNQALNGLGDLVTAGHDALAMPDTRSWLTLPSTVHVQRLELPTSYKTMTLYAKDSKGRVINSSKVALPESGPCIIYARNTDKQMVAHVSKGSWL